MEAAVRLDLAPLAPLSPGLQTRGVSTSCPTDVLLQLEKTATTGRDEKEELHLIPPTSEWQDSPPTVSQSTPQQSPDNGRLVAPASAVIL